MQKKPLSPWQAYQAVYARYPVALFLDSVQFQKPNQRYSLIVCDVKDELVLNEADLENPQKSRERIARFLKKSRIPVFGYFGYEAAALFDRVQFRKKPPLHYPVVYLARFKKVYRYDHKKSQWLGVKPKIQNHENKTASFLVKNFRSEISRKSFLKKVKRAKNYIEAGDIYQANFSQKFLFNYRGSPLGIYERLRSINPSPFSSFIKIRELEVASASPERLIRKDGAFCETRPIAGTCSKNLSEKALRHWRRKLLGSDKERAEHLMLVDLERNDLGRVCDFRSVKVDEFMTLEKYSHVVHLVSSVSGRLQKTKTALDLLAAMFPGGTITGCPKIRCMQIIDELEPSRRGLYTGSIGYFNQEKMDWNIVIRSLVFHGGQGSFQVGAGIVYDSKPEKEYLETLAKGKAMMLALSKSWKGK